MAHEIHGTLFLRSSANGFSTSRNKVYMNFLTSYLVATSFLPGLPVQTCLYRAWDIFVDGRNSCRSSTDDSPLSKMYINVSNISFFYLIPFVLLSLSPSILVYQFQVYVSVVFICVFSFFFISYGKIIIF